MIVGDKITMVTKGGNSYRGALYVIEELLPKMFIHREIFNDYTLDSSKEASEFNLDYTSSNQWERTATITLANDFITPKTKLDYIFWGKPYVDVEPKDNEDTSNNRSYTNVILVAENDTHFQIFTKGPYDEEKRRPLILAKRDYFFKQSVQAKEREREAKMMREKRKAYENENYTQRTSYGSN